MAAIATMREVYDVYRSTGFTDTDVRAFTEGYAQYAAWLPRDLAVPVLDLGCGGGEFLEFLGSRGHTAAEGIDLSEEQIARCRARGLTRVERVDDAVAWLEARPGRFGAVVMNDVLEHVTKERCVPLLRAIRGSLRPDGALLVKVPNLSCAYGPVARYLDFTHELGFTEHSLRQVLLAAGYRDVTLDTSKVAFAWRPKRLAYYVANAAYRAAHRAVYVAAVGEDAPRLLGKLLLARASG